jgi:hypothetical protein
MCVCIFLITNITKYETQLVMELFQDCADHTQVSDFRDDYVYWDKER